MGVRRKSLKAFWTQTGSCCDPELWTGDTFARKKSRKVITIHLLDWKFLITYITAVLQVATMQYCYYT